MCPAPDLFKNFQAAFSERKTRWKRGPVNWTPTRRSPCVGASTTWTTRPDVAKSASVRREAYCEKGIRISRSEPIATSKRVTNAAPLRHKFSLEVSSSKITPRLSRPLTLSGRRTAILRSERCFEAVCVKWTMGSVLFSGVRRAAIIPGSHKAVTALLSRRALAVLGGETADSCGGSALEEGFHLLDNLAGRSRRMYDSTKLAAVPHAMSKPASELFHFANTIRQVGSINLPIVARK